MRMLLNYPFPQGILLVKELIDSYGLEVVQAYMGHIQVHAGAPGGGGEIYSYIADIYYFAKFHPNYNVCVSSAFIQENAELAVRDMLKTIAANTLVRFIPTWSCDLGKPYPLSRRPLDVASSTPRTIWTTAHPSN